MCLYVIYMLANGFYALNASSTMPTLAPEQARRSATESTSPAKRSRVAGARISRGDMLARGSAAMQMQKVGARRGASGGDVIASLP